MEYEVVADADPGSHRVLGIDFSGAVDAGRKIWLTEGTIDGDCLRVQACRRAETLPGSARARDGCLAALRCFLGGQRGAVAGLDFPFSLPAALAAGQRWDDFVRSFAGRYATPELFRRACYAAAKGAELRRATDRIARTPFGPYNLRIYRQTFYGIRDLLAPLVAGDAVSVLPMQPRVEDRTVLLEICPASTLKRLGLYRPYKGRGEAPRSAREALLEALGRLVPFVFVGTGVPEMLVDDREGDALDSFIAALTVFRVLRAPCGLRADWEDASEGHVYV